MNSGKLGLGYPSNNGYDKHEPPEDVNNLRVPNNPKYFGNQEIPPYVPILPTQQVQDLAVPLTANLASSIRKPPPGGRFELKKNMVHMLHINGQFTGLLYEDPQLYISNFTEVTDT